MAKPEDEDSLLRAAVAAEVRAAAAREDLSQDQVAEATGLHRVTINRLFQGQRSIKVEQLFALAAVLNFEPGKLLDDARDRYLQQRARAHTESQGGNDH